MPERGFVEIAQGCFVARYPEWDVSVGVVVGSRGALVVDTRASMVQGQAVRDAVRRLPGRPEVRSVVNTHQHFDHVLGNGAFDGATVTAHENALAGMPASLARTKEQIAAEDGVDAEHPEITRAVLRSVLDTVPRTPDRTFSSAATVDLGDRYVELVYPGRGHTDGDLVVRVPDCDVLFAGDLVEESSGGTPSYGPDSWPLDWAPTLDFVLGLLGPRSQVVPGHGAVVDREFVERQRDGVSAVAEIVRHLAASGVPVERALDEGRSVERPGPLAVSAGHAAGSGAAASSGWPYDPRSLTDAVVRGYAQLGVGAHGADRA